MSRDYSQAAFSEHIAPDDESKHRTVVFSDVIFPSGMDIPVGTGVKSVESGAVEFTADSFYCQEITCRGIKPVKKSVYHGIDFFVKNLAQRALKKRYSAVMPEKQR